MKIVTIALFLSQALRVVTSYPWGAGACGGGGAAVGSVHLVKIPLIRPVISRTLSASKIQIQLGGITVSEGSTVNRVSKINNEIIVRGVDGKKFRGLLIRIKTTDGKSTRGVLTPRVGTQIAGVCASPVVGITHTNRTLKSLVSGVINFPTASKNVIVEITVVFRSGALGSSHAYGNFTVNFT